MKIIGTCSTQTIISSFKRRLLLNKMFFMKSFLTGALYAEAVVLRCSMKKVFIKISQNSKENTCAKVFLIKLQAWGKKDWDGIPSYNIIPWSQKYFFLNTNFENLDILDFSVFSFYLIFLWGICFPVSVFKPRLKEICYFLRAEYITNFRFHIVEI